MLDHGLPAIRVVYLLESLSKIVLDSDLLEPASVSLRGGFVLNVARVFEIMYVSSKFHEM